MVEDEHYDSMHIRREIDLLNTKWTTFHTSVRDYRDLLDTSIQYFRLVEEVRSLEMSMLFPPLDFTNVYYLTF